MARKEDFGSSHEGTGVNDERIVYYADDLHGGVRPPLPPRRSWRKFILRMGIIGIAFGAVIVAGLRFADGPVQGQVLEASLEDSRKKVEPAQEAPNAFVGKKVSFQYPRRYDMVGDALSQPGGGGGTAGAIEAVNIADKSDHRSGLSMSVRELPDSGRMHDDSNFRLREMKPDIYKPTSEQVRGDTVVVMSKVDKMEQTLFWAHRGLLLTVSVTTSDPGMDLGIMIADIKKSVRWLE